ncbi:MAG: VanZ family protein [Thermoguttaceae bacterium]|jgi:glycopeptide antibiotics resistance protein
MHIVARFACLVYWILLTLLLLVPNPAAWVGLQAVPVLPWGKFGIHLTAFTILALLVHATRWPRLLWWPLMVLLVVYGVTTESLQIFVPSRSARVMDAVENILGVAAGSGIYLLVLWLARPAMKLSLPSELVKLAVEAETSAE